MGRCNPITKTCTRTPWWRAAMGIDFGGGSGGGGAAILWGSETVLFGSTTVTFND